MNVSNPTVWIASTQPPMQALVSKAAKVGCGVDFTVWLCDGKVWSAGCPQYGQLGHGSDNSYNAGARWTGRVGWLGWLWVARQVSSREVPADPPSGARPICSSRNRQRREDGVCASSLAPLTPPKNSAPRLPLSYALVQPTAA